MRRIVAQGKADALISAGNSGATMAASLWHLRRLPGFPVRPSRPFFRPWKGTLSSLDVGANVDCKPKHLLQFAIMGSIYSGRCLVLPIPDWVLLTIGEEEGKGNELTLETHPLLQSQRIKLFGASGRA
jgi:glycerol-3-phosphate acyltransferase PlsX